MKRALSSQQMHPGTFLFHCNATEKFMFLGVQKKKRGKLSRLNCPQKLQMLSHNQPYVYMLNTTNRNRLLCLRENALLFFKTTVLINFFFPFLSRQPPGLRALCKHTARHEWYQHIFKRLTPSQHVVPEELLLPYKDGHNDERVEVNAFAQHPEVVGGAGVLVEHRQNLAAHLQMGSRRDRKV